MQKVKEWLSGKQNFIIGRAIYRAVISGDDELIDQLDKGFTPYSHQQLIKAMQAYVEPPAPIEPPKLIKAATKQSIGQEIATDNDQEDAGAPKRPVIDQFVVNAIKTEWQIPFKKMHHLIAQLDHYGEANDKNAIAYRMDLAGQILELEQQVNSIWAKKDEYERTGQLTAAVVDELVIPTDAIELAELINRIKKGISNNRIRMQKNPDNSGYAERYQTYKMQYFKVTGKHYQDKV